MSTKSLLHLGVKGRKWGEKDDGEQPRRACSKPNQTAPPPFFSMFSFHHLFQFAHKFWNHSTGLREDTECHRGYEYHIAATGKVGNKTWVSTPSLAFFHKLILCCTFPPQLRTTCIFWSSNTHHILKMVIPHICIVLLTLKTGQIIEFTHAISFETQMTIFSNSEARNREGWNRDKYFFKSSAKIKTP